MLLRSLALRDEAMALCDPAVDMLLWKLAPINDISTFGNTAALAAACTSCNSGQQPSSGLATTRGPSQQRCYVPETHICKQ